MWLCGVLSNSNPMEVSAVSSSSIPFFRSNVPRYRKSTVRLRRGQESNRHRRMIGNRRSFGARTPRRVATAAINDVSAATDAVPVDLTWQIVVGAIGMCAFCRVEIYPLFHTLFGRWENSGKKKKRFFSLITFPSSNPETKNKIFVKKIRFSYVGFCLLRAAGVTPFAVAGIEFSKRIVRLAHAYNAKNGSVRVFIWLICFVLKTNAFCFKIPSFFLFYEIKRHR